MKVDSSWISSATFKEVVVEVVDIKFKNGKVYRYYDIPLETYEKFMKSKSKGSFFTKNIKDNFMFEVLE